MHIEELVAAAAGRRASDIHLICGLPPKIRVDGKLTNLCTEILTDADCEALARELAGDT